MPASVVLCFIVEINVLHIFKINIRFQISVDKAKSSHLSVIY